MAARRYRRFVSPKRSWRIVNRAGLYLRDPTCTPFTWTDREPVALSFLSKEEALSFIRRKFVSDVTASSLAGIRVV